ncbi:hypothetical protein POTOM_051067 [Populus tomentosa]|uniref:Uncharacterized protein n=1 Tax=Populus tomentosa TaxID=118781 RepID=A0A8X8C2T8_POPTO|nr:hypothetical protein POTOM_051067 [Populus tomentosa]
MHIEETSTEAKLGETKLKRVEKDAESKAPSGSTGESSSDVSVDVTELLDACYKKFNTRMLSPDILYEVVLVVKLNDPAYGWGVPSECLTSYPK